MSTVISTHFRGEITELQVAESFLELGYQVSKPLVFDSRYDFVVDIHSHLYRVQVKTSKLSADGSSIEFSTRTSHTNTSKTVCHSYSAKDVDYFATVYNHQCYLIPISKIGNRSFKIRLKPCRNGQVIDVNFAEDYKLENVLSTIKP